VIMDGIIIVDKPKGWTSFDVCAKIRNLSKTKKVGHSGTLDPNATGVLPIFIGKATKSIQGFIGGDKGYIAEMTLGITTNTLDSDGTEIKNEKVKIENNDVIIDVLNKYVGEQMQTPPMYSAVKVKGKRLYKLARKGIEVKREPRKITIQSIKLLGIEEGDNPKVTFQVLCTKGTYVRQLVSDIGDDLGYGAHLSNLQRTHAQPFHISQAINMDTIITLAGVDRLESILIPVESVQ
jgi:tRNA pseudouridine55 synthase